MATEFPRIEEFAAAGPVRDQVLEQLSQWINEELAKYYESESAMGREHLAVALIEKVENLVQKLDAVGYSLGRCDYGGDRNFEDSYQVFSNGEEMGLGIVLEFRGFSCQVKWSDRIE